MDSVRESAQKTAQSWNWIERCGFIQKLGWVKYSEGWKSPYDGNFHSDEDAAVIELEFQVREGARQ